MILGLIQCGIILPLLRKFFFPLEIRNLPEYQLKGEYFISYSTLLN